MSKMELTPINSRVKKVVIMVQHKKSSPQKSVSRYLSENVKNDLAEKMVFLGGPRQVGKTTLAQGLIKKYHDGHPAYINWDSDLDRMRFRNREWPRNASLLVFDEIHKMKNWRNAAKGLFDTLKKSHQFLITGSAKLDHFKKGGDSLMGRYFYYRLHPLSLPELDYKSGVLERLFQYGGFPESYYKSDDVNLRRWHLSRISQLIKTDIMTLENVKDLNKLELLALELPRRVGSPLSHKSIAEDLEIDPKTAKNWVQIFDTLYYSFQIAPYGSPKIRAVKKEQKLYLWDWSQIEDKGARFENMVASHLLKFCHYHQDVNGHRMELRYLRDTDKREIDFVVLKNNEALFAVECKLEQKPISPHIHYFKERTKIQKFYQVSFEGVEKIMGPDVVSLGFEDFCRAEDLV